MMRKSLVLIRTIRQSRSRSAWWEKKFPVLRRKVEISMM